MGKEVITIHIGQAGVQMSHALWELVCLEHGISPDGTRMQTNLKDGGTGEDFVFKEAHKNVFVPRAILVDMESSVVDEVKTGAYRKLWGPRQLITGKEDAASNFSRGYYSRSRFDMNELVDTVHHLVEQCENVACFKLLYSVSGGTGSGLTSALCERLSDEYGKKYKFATTIYPSPGYSEIIVEPYNAMLHSATNIPFCDCAVLCDNEAMMNVAEEGLRIRHSGFTTINRVIANAVTTQFLAHRYNFIGQSHSHVDDLLINLIPYPRIHFPMMAFSPLLGPSTAEFEDSEPSTLVRGLFEDTNQLLSVTAHQRLYISCALLFRGAVNPMDAIKAVNNFKGDHFKRARFVDWCPTGFKLGVNFAPPMTVNSPNALPVRNSNVSMIAGNLSIRDVWNGISYRFDQLYQKKAYVHWFVSEGMEESEFIVAREMIQQLVDDYEEIAREADSVELETITNNTPADITKSVTDSSLKKNQAIAKPTADQNARQTNTLDEQNSLKSLENNPELTQLDSNQHYAFQRDNEEVQIESKRICLMNGKELLPDVNQLTNSNVSKCKPKAGRQTSNVERNRRRLSATKNLVSNEFLAQGQTSSPKQMSDIAHSLLRYGTNCSAAVVQRIASRSILTGNIGKTEIPAFQPNKLLETEPATKLKHSVRHSKSTSRIPRPSKYEIVREAMQNLKLGPCDPYRPENVKEIVSSVRDEVELNGSVTPSAAVEACHADVQDEEDDNSDSVYLDSYHGGNESLFEECVPKKTKELPKVHPRSRANVSHKGFEDVPDASILKSVNKAFLFDNDECWLVYPNDSSVEQLERDIKQAIPARRDISDALTFLGKPVKKTKHTHLPRSIDSLERKYMANSDTDTAHDFQKHSVGTAVSHPSVKPLRMPQTLSSELTALSSPTVKTRRGTRALATTTKDTTSSSKTTNSLDIINQLAQFTVKLECSREQKSERIESTVASATTTAASKLEKSDIGPSLQEFDSCTISEGHDATISVDEEGTTLASSIEGINIRTNSQEKCIETSSERLNKTTFRSTAIINLNRRSARI